MNANLFLIGQSSARFSILLNILFSRFLASFIVLQTLSLHTINGQVPVAYYDFENNAARTSFENAVEQDINASASALTKVGGSTSIVGGAGAGISNYSGLTAGEAAQSSGWVTTSTDPLTAATNYFQFSCSTTGFAGIVVYLDAFPSVTDGPNRINVTYSVDGGSTFNALAAVTRSNASRNSWAGLSFPLALADNKSNVIIRIYGFSATVTTATLSIDNIEVEASSTVANAGTITALNESNIYTSCTSGLSGSTFPRDNFTLNTGTTLNLSSPFMVNGAFTFTVATGATLNMGANVLSGSLTGATFTLAAGANLITSNPTGVQGAITSKNQNLSSDANYEFKGASIGLFTTAPTANMVNNLTINNASNVTLGMPITANNALNFTSGKLILGTNNLIIGSTGAINNANSSNFVVTNGTGTLTQTHALNALKIYPIGSSATAYDPVKITPNGACSFSVKVAASINPSYTLSSQHASNATPRQWDISLLSGTPIITLALTSSNLTHVPPAASGIIGHWNATTWDDLIAAYANGTWTATGVSTFSPFIVSYLTPLSISLKDITVEAKNKYHLLNWTTLSEKDNAYFDIQHATDNLFFKFIGQIKGQGTSNQTNNYTYNYTPNPSVKTHYYRLRQVDFDGSETLSKIVSIESIIKNPELSIYPNNASDKLTINYESDKIINYNIFNLLGQTVQSGQLNEQKELIISPLSTGMYLLKIEDSTVKFFKN